MTAHRIDRLRVGLALLLGLALAASLVTAVAGLVLLEQYRPAGAESWSQPEPIRSSTDWVRWHGSAAVAAVVLAGAAVVLGAMASRRRSRRTGSIAAGAAFLAVLGGLVALATRSMVQFDQLALWAVAVGEDIAGYGTAAFDDRVRFVLVDGAEVAPGEYAAALVVHLGAPVAGALALAVALAVLRRGRRPVPVGVDRVAEPAAV